MVFIIFIYFSNVAIFIIACIDYLNVLFIYIWVQKSGQNEKAGPQFNIKMPSYQYRKSHCGDKTILRPSYLHNGISYTGKMTSLYWIRAQVFKNIFEWAENATVTQFPHNNPKMYISRILCVCDVHQEWWWAPYMCASYTKLFYDNIIIVWVCLREHNMAGDKPRPICGAILAVCWEYQHIYCHMALNNSGTLQNE